MSETSTGGNTCPDGTSSASSGTSNPVGRLVRRPDPHHRDRRDHRPARPGGRPGRPARGAAFSARHRAPLALGDRPLDPR